MQDGVCFFLGNIGMEFKREKPKMEMSNIKKQAQYFETVHVFVER